MRQRYSITTGMRVAGAPECAGDSTFWCVGDNVFSTSGKEVERKKRARRGGRSGGRDAWRAFTVTHALT
jgi:hypothetical protein